MIQKTAFSHEESTYQLMKEMKPQMIPFLKKKVLDSTEPPQNSISKE
jgi:hypothetical protein